MGKRIISLQEAQSITNDDYLVIDNQSGGTKKVSAGFINDIVSDVQVDGTSVVDGGVAEIDLSGKQNTLTAGSNIQIAQDGTISATDTTYTAGTNVQIDNGVISATDTTYTAGTNVQINNNVISATDTTYTAGTNVQINNGVISATDTTYSAFGGATAGADGSSGLVPQPLIADKDKFLKGDGTWDTIQPGASALDDLTNVDITSPTNGQVLKYDSTNQEWVNANESGGGGASAVADLTDVNLTSLANGQILKYDSTSQKWINSDESGGGNLSYETVFSGSKSTSAWNSPLVFNEFDVTACDIIRITAAHDSYSYTWLIDTSLIPLTGGNKLHIYGEVYCDRDDTELQMYVSTGHALEVSKIESVISGGGGGGGGAGAEEMTLDEYNALPSAQRNDGTIRFIPNGSTIAETSAIDMSSISSRKEFSMDVSSTSDQVIISWLGGNQIGGMFYYATPIDVTTWDKITFDLTTSSCYGGGSTAQQARWNVQIGLQSEAPSSVQVIDASDSRWIAVKDYANSNTTYDDQEIDVSELTGSYYLVINAHGWNAIIDDFTLEKIGATYPSQIKYMSKTYALEGDMHAYSTTEHQVGTWIDGSDLYERTINITAESFTATQDMDISNYIDSTEAVHESIGVFNYTYQGANYATPINGREVEILYWDGAYKLRLNFGSGSLDSMDTYITIRYTKTGGNS